MALAILIFSEGFEANYVCGAVQLEMFLIYECDTKRFHDIFKGKESLKIDPY